MAEVFVNYRTGDGDNVANLIVHYLSDRFGSEHVFKASRSIPAGAEYPSSLIAAVRACDILLAVMGPDWPHSARLREDDDWVRREILEALAAGKTVIPVLHGRKTDQLRAADLPQELARLAYIQSRRIDTRTSEADLEQIGQTVLDLVPGLKAAGRSTGEPAAATTDNSASDVSGTVVQSGTIGGDVVNVSGNRGPTQVGDGNRQYNSYLGELLGPRPPRPQPLDRLRWLADRFVPPSNFDAAMAVLLQPGTVILDGRPGTGRTSAAKMLLLGSSEAEQVHQLLPELSRKEAADLLTPEFIGPNDRVWLDLSEAEPRQWNLIQEELPPLHRRVIECRARLVVIKPYGAELRPDFRQFRRTVESTPAAKVFSHLLRVEGLLNGEEPALPHALSGVPSMATVQQLIDYILDARDQSAGEGDLASWITAAEERVSPREEHVTKELDALTDATQRALLLSVAMLHGAHADVIERAATTLLPKVQGESAVVLERPPLRERLTEIGARPESMRHVRFSRPGYDFAIRAFFWKHFPDLHSTIATWVRSTIDSRELSEDEQEYLVRGFVDQCLDPRYQDFWTDLVRYLTSEPTNPSRMTAAAAVLRHGLRDQKSSRTFRQQIYRWSLAGDLSLRLAAVLVEACLEMANTHPEQAIVRLHHVTRHYPEQTVARETLTELAGSDPWLLSYFLARVGEARTEEARQTDATLFLDIADPALFTTRWPASRLISQRQVVDHLAGGWALAFTWLPPQTWVPVAREWLRGAADDSANQAVLLEVLVAGASQRADLLSALFGMAHRGEFRDVIAGPLLEKICAAQGVKLT